MVRTLKQSLLYVIAITMVSGYGCSTLAPTTAPLEIVKQGKSNAYIHVQEQASPSEQLGATELQTYLEKMSGTKVPISKTAIPGIEIIIGTLSTLKALPQKIQERLGNKAVNDQAFYIKTTGNKIYVVGKEPIGALYGAYTLLEKLGVKWLYPGEQGECYPKTKTIALNQLNDLEEPSLDYRSISFTCASYNFAPSLIWMARNKMNIKGTTQPFRIFDGCTEQQLDFFNSARNAIMLKGGHSIFSLAVPKEKFFKTHPEYFALLDGKRTCTKTGREQRCVSNPAVLKLCEDMIYEHTKNGKNYNYLFGAEDKIGTWCQCEKCKKMGTANGKFSITNLVHRFFSTLERNVLKRNPDARFSMHIYTDYRVPPTAEDVIYKHTLGLYCSHQRCYVHRFDDPNCKSNKKQYAEFKDWVQICPGVALRDYIQIAKCEYAPFEYVVGQDIKNLVNIGAGGWTDECPPAYGRLLPKLAKQYPIAKDQWLSNWPTYYVAAKVGWNSNTNVDKLMNDAYTSYYGKAAPAMLKYQTLRRKLWKNAPGHAFYGGPARTGFCLTVPGAEKKLYGYLDEAEKAVAGNELLLKRIAMDRDFLTRFWKKEAEKRKKLFSAERKIIPQESHKPITIDGDLSEDVWLKARPISDFISLTNKEAPQEKTSVRVAYDKDNLYFGIVAMTEKAWGPVIAKVKEQDGNVWSDDSVELQIAPPKSDSVFYHIMSNTKGVVYDSRVSGSDMNTKYDTKCDVKVKKLEDRFVYEFKIPQSSFDCKVEPGQVWQMHFLRNCKNLQPPASKETSTVDGTAPHALMNFRRAVFGNSVIKNGNFSELIKKKESNKGVKGNKFPKKWGVSSQETQLIPTSSKSNKLQLTNGVIYQYMSVPPTAKEQTLQGEITASGTGTLTIKTSTCLRPPSSDFKSKPFTHSIKKEIASFELSEKTLVYKFKTTLAPYEIGYIYIYSTNQALIDFISASLTDKKSN